jgi:hypothetical protein
MTKILRYEVIVVSQHVFLEEKIIPRWERDEIG